MSVVNADRSGLLPAAALTGSFAALWVVLAWNRPGVTFHFGPLVVAAMLPYAYVTMSGRRPSRRLTAAMVGGATATALALAFLLAAVDRMEGPSLLPAGGALAEAVVFAVAGGAIGLLALLRLRGAA